MVEAVIWGRVKPVRRVVGVLVLLVVLVGCSEGGGRAQPTTVRDSAAVAVVENDLTRVTTTCAVSASPTVTIGTAEGAPEHELYRVFGATRLSDGRIVLVNQGSQQIRYFDQKGQYLSASGREGGGPGEFRNAFYIWSLPGDTVWVGDYRPWQFNVFAPDGKYVRTVRPSPEYGNPPGVIAVLESGRQVLADRSFTPPEIMQFAPRHLTVVIHAPDGTLIDTLGTYENGRWGRLDDDPSSLTLYRLFESFARIAAQGSRVYVAHSSKPEVSIFDAASDPRLERIVRFTTGDRSISSSDVAAERKRLAEPYIDLDPGMRARMVDPLISEKRPIADQFPAFSSLMPGRDGRLWVKEFARPQAVGPARWIAFDAGGRFQCFAVVPEVDEVLEFGPDYLLAKQRDEDGVERVVQYSIGQKP